MVDFKCDVCNNVQESSTFVVNELMQGLNTGFKYIKCSSCGCLQIKDKPDDIQNYYPEDTYYSFAHSQNSKTAINVLLNWIRLNTIAYFLGQFNFVGFMFRKRYSNVFKWFSQLKGVDKKSSILDIGCGSGDILLKLQKLGFKDLTGVDPFIKKEIVYTGNLKVLKKNIFEIDKQYDFIMLNHSFEHMDNPNNIFQQLHRLLKPNGRLLIRIPVIDSYCWRKYGIWWYQIDAPRHFFIHSVKSMSILAKNNNFELGSIEYDSNENQFLYSEKYLLGLTLNAPMKFNEKQIRIWRKEADYLNKIKDGDQCCFNYYKK